MSFNSNRRDNNGSDGWWQNDNAAPLFSSLRRLSLQDLNNYSFSHHPSPVQQQRQQQSGGGRRIRSNSHSQQEGTTTIDDSDNAAATVADFQEVFNELKTQNPDVSMGALKQKTMQKIAELKAQKERQDRENREKEERNMEVARDQESGRKRQFASKLSFDKWVGKMRQNASQDIYKNNDDNDDNDQISSDGATRPGGLRGSFNIGGAHFANRRSHLDDSSSSDTLPPEKRESHVAVAFTQIVPVQTALNVGRRATSIMLRRNSVDSNVQSSTIVTKMNDGSGILNPSVRSDPEENFAPKRSVEDFSAMDGDLLGNVQQLELEDDHSNNSRSILSDISGVFLEGEMESDGVGDGSERLGRMEAKIADEVKNWHVNHNKTYEPTLKNFSGNKRGTDNDDNDGNDDDYDSVNAMETCSPILHVRNDDIGSYLSSFRKGSSSDLSVEFGEKSPSMHKNIHDNEDDEDDDYDDQSPPSGGFAADFSAWENREYA